MGQFLLVNLLHVYVMCRYTYVRVYMYFSTLSILLQLHFMCMYYPGTQLVHVPGTVITVYVCTVCTHITHVPKKNEKYMFLNVKI